MLRPGAQSVMLSLDSTCAAHSSASDLCGSLTRSQVPSAHGPLVGCRLLGLQTESHPFAVGFALLQSDVFGARIMRVPLALSMWLPAYLLLKAIPFLSLLPTRPTLSVDHPFMLSSNLPRTVGHAWRTHARAHARTRARTQEREKTFKDATTHIANIGEMVEDMEGRMRDALYEVD